MRNKYVFFREYYKPICIAQYSDDARAEAEAQKLANELGESVIVCRHLTMCGADRFPVRDNEQPVQSVGITRRQDGGGSH